MVVRRAGLMERTRNSFASRIKVLNGGANTSYWLRQLFLDDENPERRQHGIPLADHRIPTESLRSIRHVYLPQCEISYVFQMSKMLCS